MKSTNDIFGTTLSSVPAPGQWGHSRLSVIDSLDMLSTDMPQVKCPYRNRNVLSIVCISGSVHIDYDMRHMTLNASDIMALLPGHMIEGYKVSDDFKGFMIVSPMSNFANFLPIMSRLLICSFHFRGNPVIHLSEQELRTQMLFHDLLRYKQEDHGGMFDSLVVNKLCEGIFCETLNIYFRRMDINVATNCRRSETLFYRFVVSIEQHILTERSVAFYANELCVTPKHLSAAVKEVSGRTAGEWIDSYVIEEIKRLLSTTEMNIQEISCRMKFANQSFFGKYFKKHTGMSPREFRSKLY